MGSGIMISIWSVLFSSLLLHSSFGNIENESMKYLEDAESHNIPLQNFDLPPPGRVNLAFGRPTFQSSTWKDLPSSQAVDGNIETFAHTNESSGRFQWFVVDLGQPYSVHHVVLTNRLNCCGNRMDYFLVGITDISPSIQAPTRGSHSICGQHSEKQVSLGERMTVYCHSKPPPSGRYVVIYHNSNEAEDYVQLQIAELEVYAYEKIVINLRSYGRRDLECNIDQYGFVKMNNNKVFGSSLDANSDPNHRGINTFILNYVDYSIKGWQRFDTHADVDQTKNFIEYFNQLRDGAILLGITADEPYENLGPALRLLHAAGVDVYDVGIAGKFAFILQKGYPEKTVMSKRQEETVPLELNVSVTGSSKETIIFERI